MARVVTIKEYERGLRYVKGRLEGVLEAGRYRVWAFRGQEILKVDMRENALQVPGQEVLTADNAPVRLNLLVRYRVVDPVRAMHEVASYLDALHQVTQLVVRDLVIARALDEFLAQRVAVARELAEVVAVDARRFGVEVVTVAIKDAMLIGELKQAYEARLTADQKGQADLVAARHEVAAVRARANAAKLAAETPGYLEHRRLDILEKAATQGFGNTFVMLPEWLETAARKLTGQ
jgi:regulator of protease activity HflC (stomatin/prohibitin superfamily)